MKTKSSQTGFSLVELAIVVVILGILATLAVPRFRTSVEKTKAKEATNYLSHIETSQAIFMAEMGRYAYTVSELEERTGASMELPEFFYVSPMWARDWEKDWHMALYRDGASSGFGQYYINWDQDGFVPKTSTIPSELAPQSSRTSTGCSGPIPSSRGIADQAVVQS
jgi:prepilin-type N-terminal cleavage/methylation domain-containing protein